METATGWIGETACLLQAALRMSNETFARHLRISLRTVAGWHEKPKTRPRPETQQLLDSALARADPETRDRFAVLCGKSVPGSYDALGSETAANDQTFAAAERRLAADPNIGRALSMLDDLADWEPGTARSRVAAQLTHLDRRNLLDRADRRSRIGQPAISEALANYYRDMTLGFGRYAARLPAGTHATSVLTHPDWLDLECSLTAGNDRLTLAPADTDRAALDTTAAAAAAQRLAETLTAGTRFTESTLYRLTDIDIAPGKIGGTLGLSRFTSYALTLDLLEGELNDALAGVSESGRLR